MDSSIEGHAVMPADWLEHEGTHSVEGYRAMLFRAVPPRLLEPDSVSATARSNFRFVSAGPGR